MAIARPAAEVDVKQAPNEVVIDLPEDLPRSFLAPDIVKHRALPQGGHVVLLAESASDIWFPVYVSPTKKTHLFPPMMRGVKLTISASGTFAFQQSSLFSTIRCHNLKTLTTESIDVPSSYFCSIEATLDDRYVLIHSGMSTPNQDEDRMVHQLSVWDMQVKPPTYLTSLIMTMNGFHLGKEILMSARGNYCYLVFDSFRMGFDISNKYVPAYDCSANLKSVDDSKFFRVVLLKKNRFSAYVEEDQKDSHHFRLESKVVSSLKKHTWKLDAGFYVDSRDNHDRRSFVSLTSDYGLLTSSGRLYHFPALTAYYLTRVKYLVFQTVDVRVRALVHGYCDDKALIERVANCVDAKGKRLPSEIYSYRLFSKTANANNPKFLFNQFKENLTTRVAACQNKATLVLLAEEFKKILNAIHQEKDPKNIMDYFNEARKVFLEKYVSLTEGFSFHLWGSCTPANKVAAAISLMPGGSSSHEHFEAINQGDLKKLNDALVISPGIFKASYGLKI